MMMNACADPRAAREAIGHDLFSGSRTARTTCGVKVSESWTWNGDGYVEVRRRRRCGGAQRDGDQIPADVVSHRFPTTFSERCIWATEGRRGNAGATHSGPPLAIAQQGGSGVDGDDGCGMQWDLGRKDVRKACAMMRCVFGEGTANNKISEATRPLIKAADVGVV